MRGRWRNYDDQTQVAEVSAIPQPDRGALFHAMDRYRKGDEVGFVLKDYGEGLLMLKKDKRSGRALFCTDDRAGKSPLLVLLLAYKKESDEAPVRFIQAARKRMGEYFKRP